MQRYFIHCFLHANSKGMRVVYVGKCSREEAEAKFAAAAREESEFEVMTLHDGGGHEIARHEIPPEEQAEPTPLRTWMSVRLWPQAAV